MIMMRGMRQVTPGVNVGGMYRLFRLSRGYPGQSDNACFVAVLLGHAARIDRETDSGEEERIDTKSC